MLIPGTNGGKMSKSANNIINIFLDDKGTKQIMSIETMDTPLLKNLKPETCNAFMIYSLLANQATLAMKQITLVEIMVTGTPSKLYLS
jgi:tryptophanyl-tRNA synthetase